jgi:hypothetical protein
MQRAHGGDAALGAAISSLLFVLDGIPKRIRTGDPTPEFPFGRRRSGGWLRR